MTIDIKVTEEILEGKVNDFQVEAIPTQQGSKKWIELSGTLILEVQSKIKIISIRHNELIRYLDLFMMDNQLKVEVTKHEFTCLGDLNLLTTASSNTPVRELEWTDIPEPTDRDIELEAYINEITEVQ